MIGSFLDQLYCNYTSEKRYICGDDSEAKEIVASLAQDIGFEVVDVGDLKAARLLEPLGMLWIHLALMRGMGRDFAINLVKR